MLSVSFPGLSQLSVCHSSQDRVVVQTRCINDGVLYLPPLLSCQRRGWLVCGHWFVPCLLACGLSWLSLVRFQYIVRPMILQHLIRYIFRKNRVLTYRRMDDILWREGRQLMPKKYRPIVTTVTIWNVYEQQWLRTGRPSARVLASLSKEERERVLKHVKKIIR